jgi:hypothetical protein
MRVLSHHGAPLKKVVVRPHSRANEIFKLRFSSAA